MSKALPSKWTRVVLLCGLFALCTTVSFAQNTPEIRQRSRVQGTSEAQNLVQPTPGMTSLVTTLQAHLSGQKPKTAMAASMLMTLEERSLVLQTAGSGAQDRAELDNRQQLLLSQLEDLYNKIARVEIKQVERIQGNNGLVAYRMMLTLVGKEATAGGNLKVLAVEVGSGFKFLMLDN